MVTENTQIVQSRKNKNHNKFENLYYKKKYYIYISSEMYGFSKIKCLITCFITVARNAKFCDFGGP